MTGGTPTPPDRATTDWPWWKEAVFYQIYPRSFCLADPVARARRRAGAGARDHPPDQDSGYEGSGDLEGIRRHLDHLVWLGVDAIWLSPFYPSPMRDFGYDVSDYENVDPLFGTLEDFDRLVADAHERGLRVIVDFVPNHTSSDHPWFLDARSSRDSKFRDFYVWRDPDPDEPDKPPNNWKETFGEGPAWTFDKATGQWYLHLFLPEQPDLDWSNPAVVSAMTDVLGYWLARGVDGFRIDVVHALGKDPALLDVAPELAEIPYSALNDDERTHPILRHLRAFIDTWPGDRVTVGEVFLLDTSLVVKYYGDGDELHLAFNFRPMFCPFDAGCFRRRVAEVEKLLSPHGFWPTWVLSSHDRPRHRTRYGGSERRARAVAVMIATMRGTPFLYAGEELGLEDAVVPPDAVVDPGGRDGCRAPIPWDPTPTHGWALESEPWLRFPPEVATRNVEALKADESSILHLYRHLLAIRRSDEVLRRGDAELGEVTGNLLAVRRHIDGRQRWILVNFGEEAVEWAPDGGAEGWNVALTSGGEGALSRAGTAFGGSLGPEEALVLRPSST